MANSDSQDVVEISNPASNPARSALPTISFDERVVFALAHDERYARLLGLSASSDFLARKRSDG
jgi:hypothetical protein